MLLISRCALHGVFFLLGRSGFAAAVLVFLAAAAGAGGVAAGGLGFLGYGGEREYLFVVQIRRMQQRRLSAGLFGYQLIRRVAAVRVGARGVVESCAQIQKRLGWAATKFVQPGPFQIVKQGMHGEIAVSAIHAQLKGDFLGGSGG